VDNGNNIQGNREDKNIIQENERITETSFNIEDRITATTLKTTG
jgi:hypothetical protein